MRATMDEHGQRKSINKSLIGDVDNDTSEAPDSPNRIPAQQDRLKLNMNSDEQDTTLLNIRQQEGSSIASNKIYTYSLIGNKKAFGNNRSQSLAPPIISQKTITGE